MLVIEICLKNWTWLKKCGKKDKIFIIRILSFSHVFCSEKIKLLKKSWGEKRSKIERTSISSFSHNAFTLWKIILMSLICCLQMLSIVTRLNCCHLFNPFPHNDTFCDAPGKQAF